MQTKKSARALQVPTSLGQLNASLVTIDKEMQSAVDVSRKWEAKTPADEERNAVSEKYQVANL